MELTTSQKLKQILEKKNPNASGIRWNSQNQKWQKMVENYFGEEPIEKDEVTNLTFNVLTDMFGTKIFKAHVIMSQERYRSILKDVGAQMPDIISFNEVSTTFNKMVMECLWVRQHYWVNQYFHQKDRGFSNLLLCKIRPICFQKIKVQGLQRPVQMAFFLLKNKEKKERIVSFTSIHLSHQFSEFKKREKQLTHLIQQLQKYKGLVDTHILQGDMNFHSEEENKCLPNLNLKDAWLQKHTLQEKPGYTLDTDYNQMTYEMSWGFRQGRMRLDRIFILGNQIQVKDIQIIFNEPIYGKEVKETVKNGITKGWISWLSDIVASKNIFRSKEAYLFKSDHFGLKAEFTIA